MQANTGNRFISKRHGTTEARRRVGPRAGALAMVCPGRQLIPFGIRPDLTVFSSSVIGWGFFNLVLVLVFLPCTTTSIFKALATFLSHIFFFCDPTTLLQRRTKHNISSFIGPTHVLACRENMFTESSRILYTITCVVRRCSAARLRYLVSFQSFYQELRTEHVLSTVAWG